MKWIIGAPGHPFLDAQVVTWDLPKFLNEGNPADYRVADSGSVGGTGASIRLAKIRGTTPPDEKYVTAMKQTDGTLLLIGWALGKDCPSKLSIENIRELVLAEPVINGKAAMCLSARSKIRRCVLCADSFLSKAEKLWRFALINQEGI